SPETLPWIGYYCRDDSGGNRVSSYFADECGSQPDGAFHWRRQSFLFACKRHRVLDIQRVFWDIGERHIPLMVGHGKYCVGGGIDGCVVDQSVFIALSA